MNRPLTFCTVTRDGGRSWRLLKLGKAFAIESTRAESSAVSGGSGGPWRNARSRLSSATMTLTVTGWPTIASRVRSPSSVIFGGSLARISALLEPAPSAPVSDMITVLSTM